MIIDACLIFGTIMHQYITYTPHKAWGRHQYGYHFVAMFVKAVFAKIKAMF